MASTNFRFELLRQRDGHQRGGRRAGHGGDVAQAAGERLAPDFFRRRVFGEMNAFDHRIGFEQQPFVRHAQIQHGAIIARAGHDIWVRRQRFGQARDEFKFVHFGGTEKFCAKKSKTRFAALNRLCAAMGASRLSVFS